MRKLIPVFLLFAISMYGNSTIDAFAQQEQKKSKSTLKFYLENDFFAKTDQNYTSGLGLTWVSGEYAAGNNLPVLSKYFFRVLSVLGEEGTHKNISISARQNIYTPDNIRKAVLDVNSNPYAGVIFSTIGFHNKSKNVISSLELDIGIVGPHSYAEQSQKNIHQIIGDVVPKGWDNQLRDELVLGLNFDLRRRFSSDNLFRNIGFDFIPHYGYGAGNMKTYVNTGAQIRLGWKLPDNFGSYILHNGCECDTPSNSEKPESNDKKTGIPFHIFASIDQQAVFHDIFLDGNTFKDSHSVDKKTLVSYVTLGMSVQFSQIRLNYSYVYQTRTYKSQKSPHIFGGLTLSYLY